MPQNRMSTGHRSTSTTTSRTSSNPAGTSASTGGSCTGNSWGSVLGLAYAERHPDRAAAVIVGAVSTDTRADIDWLTVHAGRFFPAEWEAFRDHVPESLRDRPLVEAYHELLMDPDPAVHEPASQRGDLPRTPRVGSSTGRVWSPSC